MNAQRNSKTTRREAMKLGLLAGASAALVASFGLPSALGALQPTTQPRGAGTLMTRPIPKTGERLPVVGCQL